MKKLIAWLFGCWHIRSDLWIDLSSGKSHWQCLDCHATTNADGKWVDSATAQERTK